MAPARMPVVAGKKIANTAQKSVPPNPRSGNPWYSPIQVISELGAIGCWVRKMDTTEAAMIAMIPYCTRNARSELQ